MITNKHLVNHFFRSFFSQSLKGAPSIWFFAPLLHSPFYSILFFLSRHELIIANLYFKISFSPLYYFQRLFNKATVHSTMSVAPHSPSAAQRALSIPEMVNMIFDARNGSENNGFILGYNDLGKIIRVNRLWFDIGAEKLWANEENINSLFNVSPKRRQIYASKITFISLLGERLERYYHEYRDLQFWRLNKISLNAHHFSYQTQHIAPYLVSSLKSFDLCNASEVYTELFHRLEKNCPQLEEISISAKRFMGPFELFYGFIRHARLLKTVRISSFGDEHIEASDELLSCLAHSRKLERLELPWCWNEIAVEDAEAEILHSNVVPFPKMKTLSLVASSMAISNLVPLVINTIQLTLILQDSEFDVLPHLSNLRNLKILTIYYQESEAIPVESLMELGALSKLVALRLSPLPYKNGTMRYLQSRLLDYDCEVLARRWPHLRCLRLRMECNISTNAVESFLRHCPNLHTCEIYQPLDTTHLFTTAPGYLVFPQLTKLTLSKLTGEEIMRSV